MLHGMRYHRLCAHVSSRGDLACDQDSCSRRCWRRENERYSEVRDREGWKMTSWLAVAESLGCQLLRQTFTAKTDTGIYTGVLG